MMTNISVVLEYGAHPAAANCDECLDVIEVLLAEVILERDHRPPLPHTLELTLHLCREVEDVTAVRLYVATLRREQFTLHLSTRHHLTLTSITNKIENGV